jgi:hypothetical protein
MAFVAASQRQQRSWTIRRRAVAAALIVVPLLAVLAILWVTSSGPFRPADISWSKSLSNFYVADIEWSADGNMFLGGGDGQQASIARSIDEGRQWTQQTVPGNWVFDIAADPLRPDRLFAVPAAVDPSGELLLQPTVLLSSDDGGRTWGNASNAPLPLAVISLAYGADGIVYAGGGAAPLGSDETGSPVWYSRDDGLTWQPVEGAPVDLEVVFRLEPYRDGVLAGGANGLYAWSPRAGWTTVLSADSEIIDQFAYDGGTIYAGRRDGGVYKIGSDGVPTMLSPLTVTSIVPMRGQSDLFLAATNEGVLLWWPAGADAVSVEKPVEAFGGAQEIRLAVDPKTPGRIWAGSNQGLFMGDARDWLADRD